MKLSTVQALRAIAALAVVFCHLLAIEKKHSGGPNVLTDIWINGAAGVDLFFVISGFIMVWVAGDMPQTATSTSRFLYSRFTRIYPLWWLFAAAMAGYFLLAYGEPWDAARLANHDLDGPSHLLASAFLLPQPDHPVLGVGWTLVHEMYFYIGFALMILALPARFRLFGILTWGALVIAGALAGLSDAFAGNFVELVFHPMTVEFVLGALVAFAIKSGFTRFAKLATIFGAAAIVGVFFTFDFPTGGLLLSFLEIKDIGGFNISWGRVLVFGLPSAILLYGLVSLELTTKLGERIPRILVSIGDWSYALYLCHILVMSAVARIIYPRFANESLFDNIVFLIVATVVSVIVSALTYYIVERPLIGLFRRLWSKPKRETADLT